MDTDLINKEIFKKYLDHSLNRKIEILHKDSSFLASIYGQYLLGLHFYLIADLDNLSKLILKLKKDNDFQSIIYLLEARKLLRLNKEKHSNLDLLIEKIINISYSEIWMGEKNFIIARYYELKCKNNLAIHYYQIADKSFNNIGCKSKALRMTYNSLVCMERESKKIPIREYAQTCWKALKFKEHSLAGILLTNLSQKLLDLGAYSSALKYANRAYNLLQVESGSFNHYNALIQKAYSNKLLKRTNNFNIDLEELKLSSHQEIQTIVKYLETDKIPSKKSPDVKLSEGWKQRLNQKQLTFKYKLSEMEDKLLGFLILSPKSKSKIMSYLWNFEGVDESIESRFKDLLSRIRKKRGPIVQHLNGLYYINVDENYI